jgi:hydrogenase assembly chaperone HypC/HupF
MCLAVPGKIVTIVVEPFFGLRTGKVDFGGIRKEVCLDYTPEARVGDYVMVHVGLRCRSWMRQRPAASSMPCGSLTCSKSCRRFEREVPR